MLRFRALNPKAQIGLLNPEANPAAKSITPKPNLQPLTHIRTSKFQLELEVKSCFALGYCEEDSWADYAECNLGTLASECRVTLSNCGDFEVEGCVRAATP